MRKKNCLSEREKALADMQLVIAQTGFYHEEVE